MEGSEGSICSPESWGRIACFWFSTQDFALLGSLPLETWTLSLARRVAVCRCIVVRTSGYTTFTELLGHRGRSFGTQQASKALISVACYGSENGGHP